MVKVLRIINRFNLGGPTYNAALLTKHLSNDFKTLLVGGEIDESENSSLHILEDLGLRPIIIPEMRRSINYNNDLIAYYKIKQIIQRYKPDVVHTHASKAGSLGRWAAYRCGVPLVVHTFHGHVFHSYFGPTKTSLVKSVERSLARISNVIVAISKKQKEELVDVHRIAPEEKVEVVPLGFDLNKFQTNKEAKRASFREQYNIKDHEIAVGIIGRLVPIKNHAFFIDTIADVLKRSDLPFRFFIIGDGELKPEIEERAAAKGITTTHKKGVSAQLTFTSWIKNIDSVTAGLDIVSLCSLNEGTPVSLIEAQASGTPILSTNVGGVEDAVVPGETAILTNLNSQEFADKLIMLGKDESLRNSLSSKGWEFVSDKYHYTRLVRNIQDLYEAQLYKSRARRSELATA